MSPGFLALVTLMIAHAAYSALPEGYVELSGEVKRDLLITFNKLRPYNGELPTRQPGPLSMVKMSNPLYLVQAFTTRSDEWEEPGRQKLIHTYGSVAPVQLMIFPNSTYSGIFKAGTSAPALIRLSLAKQDSPDFIPALALKVFIDGQDSRNIIAMFSQDGQGRNKNFFANKFQNIAAPPTGTFGKLLAKALALALLLLSPGTDFRPLDENNLPLYEHASVTSQGIYPSKVVAPYLISFTPNPSLGYNSKENKDFRRKLGEIPGGTLLYTVAVRRDMNATEEIVGRVVTEGQFVASKYGDTSLFFQHHRLPWKE